MPNDNVISISYSVLQVSRYLLLCRRLAVICLIFWINLGEGRNCGIGCVRGIIAGHPSRRSFRYSHPLAGGKSMVDGSPTVISTCWCTAKGGNSVVFHLSILFFLLLLDDALRLFKLFLVLVFFVQILKSEGT